MKKKLIKKTNPETFQFQSELEKVCHYLETGMQINAPDEIPPEIKSEFLKNMEAFENAWRNSKEEKLFDILGCPEFKNPDALSAREVTAELKKITDLMAKHNFRLDTINPVDDRTLYRFITTELMQKQINNISIPGMVYFFIYEEYYPNHVVDIKTVVTNTVYNILRKSDYHEALADAENILNYRELQLFCNAFEKFTIHHFAIGELQISEESAEARFHIKFTGNIDRAFGHVTFEGKGCAGLVYEYNTWVIKYLELPE